MSLVACPAKKEGETDIVIIGRPVSSPVEGKTIRAFSIAHKHTLDIGATEEAFYKKMKDMVVAIEAQLSRDYTNLIVFPEDAGLVLAFLGSRGEEARSEKFALNAFVNLFDSYSESISYYIARFGPQSPSRILTLALTDTLWRPFYNTYSRLAHDYSSYILSCTNVAEAELSADPGAIAALGDPDFPERSDVYVASSPNVWNTCFLFNPSGEIVHRTKKVNLVPAEKELLDLTNGILDEATVYNIPGTEVNLCVGISLDAFIDSFVKHMDSQGCNVLLQPDANPGMWAYFYPYWQPDDWLGSVMGTLQYENIEYNVNPMMTGNFFDMVFDGQSAITAKYDEDIRRDINYVGNYPIESLEYANKYLRGGFLLMGPWVEDDPVVENPGLSIDERRQILRQKSLALAAPSACQSLELDTSLCGAEENQYLETILWADLVLR